MPIFGYNCYRPRVRAAPSISMHVRTEKGMMYPIGSYVGSSDMCCMSVVLCPLLADGSLIDIHSDDGSNCFIEVREPSATATKTSTPEGEAPGDAGVPTPASPASGPTSGFPTSKVENTSFRTLEMSGSDEILTEPALATATAASAATVTAAPVAVTSEPSVAGASVETASDDDDSSWGARSEAENPGALRRTGSNSSISTLDSTSTASSTWPSVGFVTPARADIPRGGATGGRVSGRGRGHVSGASISSTDSFPAGIRTPLSHAGGSATPGRMEPDTPSPRSGSGSVHGTPHVSMRVCHCLVRFLPLGGGFS